MRFAINPLQWYQRPDGTLDFVDTPPLDRLLTDVASAGFTAMHTEPWAGGTLTEYRRLHEASGVDPAPGYIACDTLAPLPSLLETARVEAARHRALGLDRVFLAGADVTARRARPAIGIDLPQRLDERIDVLGAVAETISAEGVRPCFHQHVGTAIETGPELRALLEAVPDLGFGPDLGHLTWAGIDPLTIMTDYRERIGALHLKDARVTVRDAALAAGDDYVATTLRGIWAEPGDGDVDLVGALDLVAGIDGVWVIAEVDFTRMPTPLDSARHCAEWINRWRTDR